jgi:hypothetical protein
MVQNRMVEQANQIWSEKTFNIEDQIYLKLQPYRQKEISSN